jgi:pimeloyl-ACP methyl ester carboxylesterase
MHAITQPRGGTALALALVAALLVLAGTATAETGTNVPARTGSPPPIVWSPDTLTTFEGVTRDVEFTWLTVPEDRSRPDSRRVRLGVLRYRCQSPQPGPPIVYLSGGPGIPATLTARIPAWDALFQRLRTVSDVVLMDQRGSGVSEPSLLCIPRDPLPVDAFASATAARGALKHAFASCARGLRQSGVRPEAYNTRSIAQDFADLRAALGAPSIRLLAHSYGTELAMEIMRRDEEAVDRVVLVGARGPEQALRLPAVLDMQLRRLGGYVEHYSEFAAAWADPIGLVRGLIGSLDAAPITVTIEDRRTGRPLDLTVGGVGLQLVLQGDLIDPNGFATLPAALAALAEGDKTLFAAKIGAIYNLYSVGANLLPVIVECASGADPDRRSRLAREDGRSVVGAIRGILQEPSLCAAVGSVDLGADYRIPIFSKTPTLFVTGALDATAPSFQVEELRWGFPRSVHLVVANGWHDLLPMPEVQEIVTSFLAEDDVSGRRILVPPPTVLSREQSMELLAPR